MKHFLSFEVVRTALAVNLLAGPSRIGGLPLHTFSFCLKEKEKRFAVAGLATKKLSADRKGRRRRFERRHP